MRTAIYGPFLIEFHFIIDGKPIRGALQNSISRIPSEFAHLFDQVIVGFSFKLVLVVQNPILPVMLLSLKRKSAHIILVPKHKTKYKMKGLKRCLPVPNACFLRFT